MHVPEFTRNLKISTENLTTSFNDIREAVKTIWDRPLLQHYTNHGLDHSERVIEKLDNLLEGQTNLLNEYESFILLASAYLHDVGMQSPSHAGLPCRSEYTIRDLEIVREKHNEASAKMIMESVSRNRNLSLGLERCKDHVGFVATLSRYHRKLDINEVKDTSIAGKEIKLRLLTALLRLGDALDQDYRRVNMEILKLRDIPVQSKFYWWSHHYLSSILVKAGRIELYFRFPEEYRSDKIIEVFRGKVSESVRDQFLEVYDVLDNYGIRLYRDVVIEEENYVPEGALMLVPDDLLEYIKEYILKPKESSQELSVKTGVTWFVDGVPYSDNAEVVRCLTNLVRFTDEGRNLEAVKEIEKCDILTVAPKERMILLGIGGNCYYILGKLSEAENRYRNLLKISERVDLREIYGNDVIITRANTLGNIGLIYKAKGDLDNALKHFQEALKIHREIGYRQGEANQLGNIGLIYSDKGDLDNALKHHQEALKIDREIGYRQGEANQLGNIGLIYSDKGDLNNALKHLQEALKIFNISAPRSIVQTLNNIATIYFKLEKHEKGFEYLARAISLSSSVEQFNTVLFLFQQTVKEMIVNEAWEDLQKIYSAHASEIIRDKSLLSFFKVISKYALYRRTGHESHRKSYKAGRQKLDFAFRKLFDGLLEVEK